MASIKMNPLDVALLEARAEVAFQKERAERAEKGLEDVLSRLTDEMLMAIFDIAIGPDIKP